MVPRNIAIIGFRVHTGWAAAVAATPGLEILERRRIEFVPAVGRFIYHHAVEIPPDESARLIASAQTETIAAAVAVLGALLSDLERRELAAKRVCVPAGNSLLPGSLDAILSCHSRIHAAEGAFYREALVDACARLGLLVTRAPERDLLPLAAHALGWPEERLRLHLKTMGKRIGPPWSEDQRHATLAAATALLPLEDQSSDSQVAAIGRP